MDVVSEGRNASGSGTSKRESGAGSEPGGSDKDSDNDEKVFITQMYSIACKLYQILFAPFLLCHQ